MKICPACGRDYVDELSYCLEDGTPLSEPKITERKTEQLGEAETFARSAQTVAASAPRPASSNKLGVFVFVTLSLLVVFVLLVAGLASIWFYVYKKNEVVHSNETNVDRAVNWNSNRSNTNIAPTASPFPSPTRDTVSGKTP